MSPSVEKEDDNILLVFASTRDSVSEPRHDAHLSPPILYGTACSTYGTSGTPPVPTTKTFSGYCQFSPGGKSSLAEHHRYIRPLKRLWFSPWARTCRKRHQAVCPSSSMSTGALWWLGDRYTPCHPCQHEGPDSLELEEHSMVRTLHCRWLRYSGGCGQRE